MGIPPGSSIVVLPSWLLILAPSARFTSHDHFDKVLGRDASRRPGIMPGRSGRLTGVGLLAETRPAVSVKRNCTRSLRSSGLPTVNLICPLAVPPARLSGTLTPPGTAG